mmetsp:Transcript_19572/g.44781  ORF Transcript_19572/g.44781 Transcript_19572/m.44781 type:complete len:242 (-) Transcript_19572:88-813(-)
MHLRSLQTRRILARLGVQSPDYGRRADVSLRGERLRLRLRLQGLEGLAGQELDLRGRGDGMSRRHGQVVSYEGRNRGDNKVLHPQGHVNGVPRPSRILQVVNSLLLLRLLLAGEGERRSFHPRVDLKTLPRERQHGALGSRRVPRKLPVLSDIEAVQLEVLAEQHDIHCLDVLPEGALHVGNLARPPTLILQLPGGANHRIRVLLEGRHEGLEPTDGVEVQDAMGSKRRQPGGQRKSGGAE